MQPLRLWEGAQTLGSKGFAEGANVAARPLLPSR